MQVNAVFLKEVKFLTGIKYLYLSEIDEPGTSHIIRLQLKIIELQGNTNL